MKKNIYTLISILLSALVFYSCSEPSKEEIKYKMAQGPIQGTFYNVTYDWDTNLKHSIDSILKDFNKSLSNFDKNSNISLINNNETNIADDKFVKMFNVAKEVYMLSDAAFDITVAPIANLWSFGWDGKKFDLPNDDAIKEALEYVGMDKVRMEGNKIYKDDERVSFISSAIAKGQSVDVVADFLKNKGLENFLVEIGGELYCYGVNPDGIAWRIGVDKPISSGYHNRENHSIMAISGQAVATSGNYRQYIEKNDEIYGHSLDPRTGYPAQNSLLSVTVVAERCIYADAYATAFMVMGLDKSVELAESIDMLEAYFIYSDEDGNQLVKKTSGMKEIIISE